VGESAKPYFYKRPSPILSAAVLAKHPLILVHGEEDDLVPVAQSLNLFSEVKKFRGLGVKLKIFSGRTHALVNDSQVLSFVEKEIR
jgi:dipeptidyl aminopeptidase/acylaminoacyl peptidase